MRADHSTQIADYGKQNADYNAQAAGRDILITGILLAAIGIATTIILNRQKSLS